MNTQPIRRHLDTRPVPPGLYTPRDVYDWSLKGSTHLRSNPDAPVSEAVAVVLESAK